MPADYLAWHFLAEDGMTRAPRTKADAPRVKVEVGQILLESRPLVMCHVGLHGSVRVLDALNYAPGPVCCRVRLSGEVLAGPDKCCASRRECLAIADASALLHEFACWCAEAALTRERERGREPDPRSWTAIAAKRQWLKGEITADKLAEASAAAWAAARDAASAARTARTAASAARTAASDAAWAAWAASDAGAARAAAWSASDAGAARAAQNEELTFRLCQLLGIEGETPALRASAHPRRTREEQP